MFANLVDAIHALVTRESSNEDADAHAHAHSTKIIVGRFGQRIESLGKKITIFFPHPRAVVES